MNYKAYRIKGTHDTKVDYARVKDKHEFRKNMLRQLIGNKEFVLMIDTDLAVIKDELEFTKDLENHCLNQNLLCVVTPTQSTKAISILGMNIRKNPKEAFLILISIDMKDFDEFYDCNLRECDLMIGVDPKYSFMEISEMVRKGYLRNFFDKKYFEDTIYDSIGISSIRTTFCISSEL